MKSSVFGLAAALLSSTAFAQSAPIVQPGAPGQASRTIDATTASRIADTSFSAYDVTFLQDMIPHHAQATQMTALVAGRTSRPEILQMAKRIDATQSDEMTWMKKWLSERGQATANPHAAHMMMDASHVTQMGMATPAQLAEMQAAKGVAFERLFLTRMINHHAGAVRMANELTARGGTAADPGLNAFVVDLVKEQQEEIKRMTAVLGTVSEDPRTALAAGTNKAGQAIRGLTLVASLPKPTGFFDPKNPYDLPAKALVKAGQKPPEGAGRSPLLSFAQTDMAFQGDVLATGNYHGFNIYRVSPTGGAPQLVSSTICPGGQGDLSIVGNLLIMSVEQARGRLDCGRQGIQEAVSAERFRGIRIFDISNLSQPRQVGAVQTCRGSHTHSVVSGPGRDGKIIVYVSGTAGVRSAKEIPSCIGDPGSLQSALFSIDVIEIPVANPAASRIIDRPRVFGDPATGSISGLWAGGDHGDGTQDTNQTDQCHDITVFPSAKIAAGACSGNGILLDISNPRAPKRIDQVVDPTFAYWHSATFNNDGTKVLFTDEWGGGGRPRCLVSDPRNWGANAIYDIEGSKLRFRNHYKLPGAADRAGELRRAQRVDHPGPGPRPVRPGLVSGRHLDQRFHRFEPADRNRLFRPWPAQQGRAGAGRLLVGLLLQGPDLRDRDRTRAGRARAAAVGPAVAERNLRGVAGGLSRQPLQSAAAGAGELACGAGGGGGLCRPAGAGGKPAGGADRAAAGSDRAAERGAAARAWRTVCGRRPTRSRPSGWRR